MARKPRILSYRDQLVEAIERFFPPQWFTRWSYHGGSRWTPQRVLWMSLLMSLDSSPNLTTRFLNSRQLLRALFPRWKVGSYSAFVQASAQWTPAMVDAVVERLRGVLREWDERWTLHGWVVMAVDGSRFECPRTTANERGLGCAGREKTTPQLFQTTVQHVGTGVPWDFRIGPGTDSERRHLDDMRASLPKHAMLVADAGFISYELCLWLIQNQYAFLLRVGANVRLLTELGFHGEVAGKTVYLWPRRQRHLPPIVLRLIIVQREGTKHPAYLVTNLLDEREFSDAVAADVYALRWGIELYYRTVKETLDHARLRSRTPHQAMLEQTWVVLGAWLLQMMTAEQLRAANVHPRCWSGAKARNAFQQATRLALGEPRRPAGPTLNQRLSAAACDSYIRTGPKQTRTWPRKKNDKPPGIPKIQPANEAERQTAKHNWAAARPSL